MAPSRGEPATGIEHALSQVIRTMIAHRLTLCESSDRSPSSAGPTDFFRITTPPEDHECTASYSSAGGDAPIVSSFFRSVSERYTGDLGDGAPLLPSEGLRDAADVEIALIPAGRLDAAGLR